MIRISPAQMQALDCSLDVEAQIGVWLARDYPAPFAAIDARQRRAMIAAACARAQAWGATSRKEQFAFVGLMAGMAPDFDRHPQVQAALTRKGADQPVLTLDQTVPAEAWEAIERDAGAIGWRLDRVLWSATPDQRVLAATPPALASVGAVTARTPDAALALAREAGRPFAAAGERALFALTLWAAAAHDPRPAYAAALDQARTARDAADGLSLRLLLDYGVWA